MILCVKEPKKRQLVFCPNISIQEYTCSRKENGAFRQRTTTGTDPKLELRYGRLPCPEPWAVLRFRGKQDQSSQLTSITYLHIACALKIERSLWSAKYSQNTSSDVNLFYFYAISSSYVITLTKATRSNLILENRTRSTDSNWFDLNERTKMQLWRSAPQIFMPLQMQAVTEFLSRNNIRISPKWTIHLQFSFPKLRLKIRSMHNLYIM